MFRSTTQFRNVRILFSKCNIISRNVCSVDIPERFISIDVECVNGGETTKTDKLICSVAVVNYDCKVLMDKIVKPSVPVHDYLTFVTGFTEQSLLNGESEKDVLNELYSLLSSNVVLVGQSPEFDIAWLKVTTPTSMMT